MALINCDFFADTLGTSCSMTVILPQSVKRQIGLDGRSSGEGGCPVLYLLHGLSDDHTIWLRRTSIERYAAPLGLAVVMPAAGRSWYANIPEGGDYWDFISRELPSLVESFFPVSRRREDTFVAGLSMGGYGAFKLALRHPERFSRAASLSGVMDIAHPRGWSEQVYRPEFPRIFPSAESVRGSDDDLFHLLESAVRSGRPMPSLFQCCGAGDWLIEDNRRFRRHADGLGCDLTYEESPGGHEWGYWDAGIQRVLSWLRL
jgi:S-formylglutathione hydrolase FrmB